MPFVDLTERVIPEVLDRIPSEVMDSAQAVAVEFGRYDPQGRIPESQDLKSVQTLELYARGNGGTSVLCVAPSAQVASLLRKVKGLGAEVATALAQAKGKIRAQGKGRRGDGGLARR